MSRLCYFGVTCFTLFLLSFTVNSSAEETGLLNRTVKDGNETYRYQVFVLRDWNKNQKWPVILFLHVRSPESDVGVLSMDSCFQCQFCSYFNYGIQAPDFGLRTPDYQHETLLRPNTPPIR
jgi:hypothetical protein